MAANSNSITNQNLPASEVFLGLPDLPASTPPTPELYTNVLNESTSATISPADYIRMLFDPDDLICLMTLKEDQKPKHIFATVEEATATPFMQSLQKQNNAGCNIYVCMNPLIAKRRVKENVAVTRTVYLDIDRDGAAALKKILQSTLVPKPHVVLQSSPRKFQVIWIVDGIQPADQERLLDALIQEFGGDPAASDCTRVLRLPGFVNHKYPEKPVVKIIESTFDGGVYTASDFKVKVAPFKLAEKTPTVIEEGDRNIRLASLAGKLRREGFNEDEILASLQTANRRCTTPLPDSEVAAIATSILRYEPAKGVTEMPAESPHGESSEPDDDEKLNLVPLSEIEAKIQRWFWMNRIPLNALTNLSGDMDKGKSLTLYDLMARATNGADMPDGAPNPFGGQPKKVLLLFSEGSLETTVKPRMMEMGATMANVLTLESVSRKGEKDPDKRQFYLNKDLGRLRRKLQENPDIVLIGFDPLTNYLGDDCNMNRSQDVRRVLTPLGELAEDCGVTVISIIHFNKTITLSAIHRTGGAAALVEVPRAAWCCLNDDDPEHKGGFVFVPIKNNLGPRIGGLRYRIEKVFITIKGEQASVPRLVWGDPTEKTADDILTLQNDPNQKGVVKARSWLEATFKDGRARKSSVVFEAAAAAGITADCLKKARRDLRMESKKVEWHWYMRCHQGQKQPWTISTDLEEKATADQVISDGETVENSESEGF